jgi:hypothetical protein
MATNQTAAAPLLLPIGHYGGAVPAGDEDPTPRHEVRRGGELIGLPEDVFAVWALTHGTPDWPQDKEWSKQTMLDRAKLIGTDGAEAILSDLIRENLAVEIRLGGAAARETARAVHMHPTMLGLGNTPEDPHSYALGFVGVPLVQVTRTIFELWRWAPVERSLWELCRFFTDMEREHGTSDPERTDTDVVLTGLLGTLPTLVSTGAIYLDLAE